MHQEHLQNYDPEQRHQEHLQNYDPELRHQAYYDEEDAVPAEQPSDFNAGFPGITKDVEVRESQA